MTERGKQQQWQKQYQERIAGIAAAIDQALIDSTQVGDTAFNRAMDLSMDLGVERALLASLLRQSGDDEWWRVL